MAMVINSNIMSLSAQRNLSTAQGELSQAMERLSSGKRINSAKDDAAGSAITSRLTSQVRGLNQAARNANDGISMIQTAEGALGETSNILQRMRELAVQSANGTYTSGNRGTLNAEVQQLVKELDRVSVTTNFNGQNLLDGTLGEVKLHVGAKANETIEVNIGEINADTLGVSETTGIGSFNRSGAVTGVTAVSDTASAGSNLAGLGSGDLIINGIAIEGATSASDQASAYAKDKSAIATATAINDKSDQTGVTAVVGKTTVGGAEMSAAAATGSITLNGVQIDIATTANADTTRAAVVAAINLESARTGVTAIDTGTDTGGVTLVAEDGRNISIYHDSASSSLTSSNTGLNLDFAGVSDGAAIYTGTVTLVAEGGKDIEISSGAMGRAQDAGFMEGVYSGTQSQVTSNLMDSTTAMAPGDVVINGVSIPASVEGTDTASSAGKEYSAIAKAAAINAVSDKTGVTAVVNENIARNTVAQATTGASVAGTINGVSFASFTTLDGETSANRQKLVDAINAISAQTGVRAVDTGQDGDAETNTGVGTLTGGNTGGGGIELIADDGRNIVVSFSNTDSAGFQNGAATFVGEFTLTSDREINITRGTGDSSEISNTGLVVGDFGGGEDGLSMTNVDISTVEGANKAINAIDNALEKVNEVRADLGAVNNRLDFTINNLTSISENASASRSRIEDADFAAETAALSRAQVLQQAGTAMLAQANAAPQQVLSLLQ